jgi:Zn-dependent metalloprotease
MNPKQRGIRAGLAAIASLAVALAVPAQPAQANQPAPPPDVIAAAAADQAAAEGTALAKGPNEVLLRAAITPGGGGLYYSAYQRTYQGLEVVGGDAVVVTDGQGTLRDTITARTGAISVSTIPALSKSAAEAVARAQLSTVDKVGKRRLVIFAMESPALAYEILLEGRTAEQAPSVLHVFVDATTGKVLDSWDDVQEGTGNSFYNGNPVTIQTQQSGGTFSTIDPTRPGVRCGRSSNQQVFTGSDDLWGNGSGTSLETACVDALYAEQREWDMLRSWLGRNGINGNGGGFPAFVGLNQANAFWNGSSATFGHSSDNQRQATNMDVVGHEFGHGIFQFTPGGSGGSNEKGGLNESTGDIFGALTEAFANNPNDPPDYQVGEEVNLVGNGPIRFMYNPSLRNHPNCFSSAIPNTEVHAAAGVQNHWFYLLAEGSNPGGGKPASPTCNGSSVTGIGVLKAGQIYYNTLLRKTSTWTHGRARLASLQAARALFPSSCTEFNTVRAAWNAVSVPAQAGEPTC